MLIHETYFTPLIITIAVISFAIAYFLLKNRINKKILVYGCFVVGFLVYFMLNTFSRKVYIVEQDFSVHRFRAIGAFTVGMKNNAEDIQGSVRMNRVAIVNKSNKTLQLDEIVYSFSTNIPAGEKVQFIGGYSIQNVFLRRGYISYFFDDYVPDEIEVRGFDNEESNYWLHVIEN